MASGKSGNFELSGTKGITVKVFWSEDYTVDTNQSVVSIDRLQVKSSSYSYVAYFLKGSITVDGVKVIEFNSTLGTHNADMKGLNTYVDVKAAGSYKNAPWTSDSIDHASDGSKTVAIAVNISGFTINGDDGSGWKVSGSKNATLTTIARASQPSCITYPTHTQDVGEFGDEISIHMNRKSSNFTHTVRYAFGNEAGLIAEGVETGCVWEIPPEFMRQIPNGNSGSGTIYVDTYNGSTKIGTKWCGFTATVPDWVKPRCTIQVLDNTDIQQKYGSLVKGLSKLYVKTNYYHDYYSPVTAYDVTANGVKYTNAEIVTDVLTEAGTTTITATVTDRRGRTSEAASASFPVLDYAPPKITYIAVHRCNKDGTANDRGEYVEVLFSGVVSPINNKNTATYTVKYKKTSVDSWTTLTTDANGWKPADLKNNYNVNNFSLIFAADGSSSFDVEVSVKDNHFSDSRSTSASTAFTLINYHPSGDALRFGGVAEKENTFQNDLEFRQVGNRYAFQPEAFGGAKGYILLAVITLNTLNVDAPIVFQINRRGALCPMNVYVRFASSSTTTDPDLASITYEGDNFGAFMVKVAESTWKLYVDNITGWSNPCLQDWFTTDNQIERLSVEFQSEIVEGTDPSVLGTYYRATPAILRSIIDCLLPVGMIIQLYSHADPNTMYPGTTWVRMENTFLWGCDENGGIGTTGGEKTHALTTNELPSHTHGAVYTGTGAKADGTDAEKKYAWYTTSGNAIAYGYTYAGGGAAHNNMPPYTQVSIWRRTA